MNIILKYILLLFFINFSVQYIDGQYFDWTQLENISFEIPRRLAWIFSGDNNEVILKNQRDGKVQNYATKPNFYCDTRNGRSKSVPNSVNQLRPGDIDIIATIGDSLSSANGGFSDNVIHLLNEHRGISFTGGGEANWRRFLTLPNILKEFNPNLYGYSIGRGLSVDAVSRLNLAEPALMTMDMPFSAKALINRMKLNPNVDMIRHWKLLTIFVGNNDFCSNSCHFRSYFEWINLYEKNLIETLRLLRDNIPRLFVNLISLPNLMVLREMEHNSVPCYILQHLSCSCLFNSALSERQLHELAGAIQLWQRREAEIIRSPEFHKNDFTVVLQPGFTNFTLPLKKSGEHDFRFFASDCFHFSQLGHALASKGLWNNMLQPVGSKSKNIVRQPVKFLCPNQKHPYIFTHKNSMF